MLILGQSEHHHLAETCSRHDIYSREIAHLTLNNTHSITFLLNCIMLHWNKFDVCEFNSLYKEDRPRSDSTINQHSPLQETTIQIKSNICYYQITNHNG